jgi:hypothetical protein
MPAQGCGYAATLGNWETEMTQAFHVLCAVLHLNPRVALWRYPGLAYTTPLGLIKQAATVTMPAR